MGTVNNFTVIADFISNQCNLSEGDYIWCNLILRKKDKTTTFGNKNNSARLIRSYNFFSVENLLNKEQEIIEICNLFNCRAGIYLNKRNEKDVAYELLDNLAERLKSRNYKGINGILDTTNGSVGSKDKWWIVDVDDKEHLQPVLDILNTDLRPEGLEKVKLVLPTYSGYHIITNKFDVMQFNKQCKDILGVVPDLHKNNPTALYFPYKTEPI